MLENIAKLPILYRAIGILVIVVGVGALMYYVAPGITGMQERIVSMENDLVKQRAKLEETRLIAEKLDDYRRQMEKLKEQLAAALTKLPDKAEVPKLLTQVSNTAKRAGLEVNTFQRKSEETKELYIEVPVEMAAVGTYRQLAFFFQRLGELERIINIGDLKMKAGADANRGARNIRELEQQLIDAKFMVTTYQFRPSPAPGQGGKKQQGKRGR